MSIALICFLCGLGYARMRFSTNTVIIVLPSAVTLFGIVLYNRSKFLLWLGLFLLFFVAGWWRGGVGMRQLDTYNAIFYQTVTIEGFAGDDAVYSERGQLLFNATDLVIKPGQKLIGSIKVEGRGAPMIYRGDKVRVIGRLYPRRGAQQAGMSFATITVISKNDSALQTLRRRLVTALQNVLPEPLASLELGLLIGQRSTLPEHISNELTDVGLIHIVAVSGYNLTIIILVASRLFTKRSRFRALAFSLSLIGVFLLFTGNSPSIVRAALVSSISLALWFFGRKMKPVLLLLLVAAITTAANPLYLWSNIGWYLSFSAFFGVLVIAPLLLVKIPNPRLRENVLVQILCETTSAQLCTLPLILYVFGRLSVVSIVANLLVVPFVPLAMLLGLILGLLALSKVWLVGFMALPTKLLLEYMISISSLLSRVSFASFSIAITLTQMLFMYVLIIFFACILYLKKPKCYKEYMEN